MSSMLAAILVTDLVGSTEMRGRIGEDRADDIRRTHDSLLGGVARTHSGEVVKGLGDGVLVRFSGAADAVACAVAMQRALHQMRHDAEVPDLAIRIGIGVGDVSMEDGDVFGTPVIEASRLCAAATGGQILVADLVRVLSHGRGEHGFRSVGALDLKGLATPLEVSEVSWTPDEVPRDPSDWSVPLPRLLSGGDRFGFAGRRDARELLADRWKKACVEERQVVLVAGEPGIGKTRLVSELARDAAEDGAVVLLGRCFEELDATYAPFVEAVSYLVEHVAAELLREHVDVVGADLSRLVPNLARRVDLPPLVRLEPEVERLRLFDAVIDVLARVGDVTPVLLVLDDLHWADASTVELLVAIIRAARPMRLAIVATYRDTDVARSHPFGSALADLRRARSCERLALMGLDSQEVEDFVERAGGQELTEAAVALAAMLHAETEGNPFFLQELLVHLAESGVLRREGDRWVSSVSVDEVGVPEGIRDVIGRRLSMLDDSLNEMLRAAAVLGQEFDLCDLAAITERDEDDLLDALDEPCQRGLVHESGVDRYRFAHALIRQTLYEELAAGRRARLHRRAVDALDARRAPVAELAHHLIAAGPRGDADRAAELACTAAMMPSPNSGGSRHSRGIGVPLTRRS